MSDPGYPYHLNSSSTYNYTYSGTDYNPSTHTEFPVSGNGALYSYQTHYGDKVSTFTPGWPVRPAPFNPYLRVGNDTVTDSLLIRDEIVSGPKAGHYHVTAIAQYMGLDSNNPAQTLGVSSSELSNCETLVLNSLMDQILNQKAQLAEYFAEWRQTVNLVISTAHRLTTAVQHIRHLDFPGASRALLGNRRSNNRLGRVVGGIPEQWLAFKYGWQPLLGDIYGSIQTLAEHATFNPPLIRAHAVKTVHHEARRSTTSGTLLFNIPAGTWVSDDAITRGEGLLEFGVSSDFGQMLAQTGLVSPYSIAWELIPYSFVVDWFVPVGAYLQRMTYDTGLVFRRGWYSRKTTASFRLEYPGANVNINVGGGNILNRTVSPGVYARGAQRAYERKVYNSMPIPRPPTFKNPFSLTHMANALSLLATSFDRPKETFNFLH